MEAEREAAAVNDEGKGGHGDRLMELLRELSEEAGEQRNRKAAGHRPADRTDLPWDRAN